MLAHVYNIQSTENKPAYDHKESFQSIAAIRYLWSCQKCIQERIRKFWKESSWEMWKSKCETCLATAGGWSRLPWTGWWHQCAPPASPSLTFRHRGTRIGEFKLQLKMSLLYQGLDFTITGLWLVEKEDKEHWIKISAGFPVLDIRANFGVPPPWHSKLTSASVGQVEPLKKRKKYFHFGPKPFQSACMCGIHFNHTNHMVLCANIHMTRCHENLAMVRWTPKN